MNKDNPWVNRPSPNARAALRLFCFPYSGAGASVFYRWLGEVPQTIEMCPVQLPGRENRLGEPPLTAMKSIVENAAVAMLPFLDRPFAFFGHSMGALVCYELARHLLQTYGRFPLHLFVSGHNAPQIPRERPPLHALPEKEFLLEVKKLNGMAKDILESEELMELILPLLRADFTACETYCHEPSEPLPCPISALAGLEDHFVDAKGLEAWREQTRGRFRLHRFSGDHFFIHTHRRTLVETICRTILDHIKKGGET